MRDKKCETCRFRCYGECHRYPPVRVELDQGVNKFAFPITLKDDWCGEWQGKDDVVELFNQAQVLAEV